VGGESPTGAVRWARRRWAVNPHRRRLVGPASVGGQSPPAPSGVPGPPPTVIAEYHANPRKGGRRRPVWSPSVTRRLGMRVRRDRAGLAGGDGGGG